MAEFLVELYVSRSDSGAVERGAEHARLAAEELTGERTPVYLSHASAAHAFRGEVAIERRWL